MLFPVLFLRFNLSKYRSAKRQFIEGDKAWPREVRMVRAAPDDAPWTLSFYDKMQSGYEPCLVSTGTDEKAVVFALAGIG